MAYVDGLWRQHLIYNLLWYVESPTVRRLVPHRAASWSWASVDGTVRYEQGEDISAYDCAGCASITTIGLYGNSESSSSPANGKNKILQLRGVLRDLKRSKDTVQNEVYVGISYTLRDSNGQVLGRFYPDCFGELWPRKVSCLEVLRLIKRSNSSPVGLNQTRGLVLAFSGNYLGDKLFKRIGYFSSGVPNAIPHEPPGSELQGEENFSIIWRFAKQQLFTIDLPSMPWRKISIDPQMNLSTLRFWKLDNQHPPEIIRINFAPCIAT